MCPKFGSNPMLVGLLILIATHSARPLECFRCESTISWSACSDHVTVEECESEHPFEDHYECVSTQMNLTLPSFVLHVYGTGCGWGDQGASRKLLKSLIPPGSSANASLEQWQRCEEDLCNSVAEYTMADGSQLLGPPGSTSDNGSYAVVVQLVGGSGRLEPVIFTLALSLLLKNLL
ncbi:uncharacterized protein LOC129754680 [Uranotaenia lowii]|uniref:uncharacterized protein LOC129754680 n=1 Tax=Uranotaenia lowii TaxID=190385 RepID=UPI0024787B27|nr:uncharacterized protein LOC129754680 [Uranotaenia lowii]